MSTIQRATLLQRAAGEVGQALWLANDPGMTADTALHVLGRAAEARQAAAVMPDDPAGLHEALRVLQTQTEALRVACRARGWEL